MTAEHVPVLLEEAVDALNLSPGKFFLDGTIGGGGHSALVAERFGSTVTIIGLDRSAEAVKRSEERLRPLTTSLYLRQESFRNLDKVLEELGVAKVDAILFDLGISSDQLEESGRGFSFQRDEPLLMTMKENPDENDLTAARILNEFDEETLELIIRGFGEERYSKRIARAIVERRAKENPPERPGSSGRAGFATTFDLLEVVEAIVPASYKRNRIHPATRTFQALRIAVNEELVALEVGLEKAFDKLRPGGRFAVISFHSLEDRLVKNSFRTHAKVPEATLITKKPITPSKEEVRSNPRSRSAKLRVIEKL